MDLERLARYRALKARWKVLDQTMVVSGDPFLGRVPEYMSAAEDEEAPVVLRNLQEDDAGLLTILDFPAKASNMTVIMCEHCYNIIIIIIIIGVCTTSRCQP